MKKKDLKRKTRNIHKILSKHCVIFVKVQQVNENLCEKIDVLTIFVKIQHKKKTVQGGGMRKVKIFVRE